MKVIKKEKHLRAIQQNDFTRSISTGSLNSNQKNFYLYCLSKLNNRYQEDKNADITHLSFNAKDFITDTYGNYKDNRYLLENKNVKYQNKKGEIKFYSNFIQDIENLMRILVFNIQDKSIEMFHLMEYVKFDENQNINITINDRVIKSYIECFNEKLKIKGKTNITEYETFVKIKNNYSKSLYVNFNTYRGIALQEEKAQIEIAITKDELQEILLEKEEIIKEDENGKAKKVLVFKGKYHKNKNDFEKRCLIPATECFKKPENEKKQTSDIYLLPIFLLNKKTGNYEKSENLFYYDKKEKTYYFYLDFSECDRLKALKKIEDIKTSQKMKEDNEKYTSQIYRNTHRKKKYKRKKSSLDRDFREYQVRDFMGNIIDF